MGAPVRDLNKEPYFAKKVRLLLHLIHGADDIQRRDDQDQVVVPVFPKYEEKD